MKKIALAFTLSVLALAGCSSEATSVDTGSADTQTQADALHAKAVEFASNVTIDRDGKPIVPADWTKVDPSVQSIAKMNTDENAPSMARTEEDLLGNGKPKIDMPPSQTCWNGVSYASCCFAAGYCCLYFPNGRYCYYP
jgi:hypothetical protein